MIISLVPSLVSYRMADKCVVKEQGKDVVGTMCGSNKDRRASDAPPCKPRTSLAMLLRTPPGLSLLFTVHAVCNVQLNGKGIIIYKQKGKETKTKAIQIIHAS